MRPVFAVDIDGVACAHAEAICRYVAEQYGVGATEEGVTTWDHDFGPITFVEAVGEAYPSPDFVMSMPVTEGFPDALARLRELFDVVFATNREQYCHAATRAWVKTNFGDLQVRFVRDKTSIGASYLLDDHDGTVFTFARAGGTAFLLRKPWNHKPDTLDRVKAESGCYFVQSFDEMFSRLAQLRV